MMCRQVRQELIACWGSTDELEAAAVEHLRVCEACRIEAALLRETRVLLHSLPAEHAPSGLTKRVVARIADEQQPAGWWSRLAAWFVPEGSPAWARATAVGVAIALAAVGGTVLYHGTTSPGPDQAIIATTVAGGAQLAIGQQEIEDLMVRHQTLELTQPLADDPGVHLVMYTSY